MTVAIETGFDTRDAGVSDHAAPTWLIILAWCLAALATAHAIYVLVAWLDVPILDQHPFRQTQTALTTYWLMRGGAFFAYETPVLGSPWSIPFEFPIYQGLVAILALMRVPLDVAGRLVSFAFLLGSLWPIRMLWRDLRLPPVGLPVAVALLLNAPQYVFWSRTFMIESSAWCLALIWLALFVRFLTAGRSVTALWAILIGLLAVLAKATTFSAFVFVGGLLLLPRCWRWMRAGMPMAEFPPLATAVAAMLLPLAGGLVWVAFSDAVKVGNPFGPAITSVALAHWNFGTTAQRLSLRLLVMLCWRALPDIFGAAWGLAFGVLAAAFFRRREALTVLVLLVAYFVPFLIFTNLYIVHSYYQYANAAFLIAALAIAIGNLAQRNRAPVMAATILVVVLIAQAWRFQQVQLAWLSLDASQDPTYRIALLARDRIPRDGSLVVLGEDWSATVPYYAQRKALALPLWTPPAVLDDVLRDPQSHLAGTEFAGVVDCGQLSQYGPARQAQLNAFLAGRSVIGEYGRCRLLAAKQ